MNAFLPKIGAPRPFAFLAIAFGALFAGAVPAAAQPADAMERLQSHFGMADTNSDGAVSRAEFKAYRAKQWSRLDRNGDGFLSQDDLPGFLQSRWNGDRAAAMRRDYDQNRDGRISHDEYVNGPAPAFDRADSDANNLVTRAEMDAAAKRELRQ